MSTEWSQVLAPVPFTWDKSLPAVYQTCSYWVQQPKSYAYCLAIFSELDSGRWDERNSNISTTITKKDMSLSLGIF
jgi:hypothetical protein